jgi:hypothetical protein
MKKSVLLLGITPIVAVGLATFAAGCGKTESTRASVATQAAPTRITREFELAGGSVETVSFSAPNVPGTLSGKWRASGRNGNDALSGFTLTDPSDAVLDSSFKGSSGSFKVKVYAEGKHTFFFENAGNKQTPRHVTLDAEFTPDEQ